jgi:hypothetical protein
MIYVVPGCVIAIKCWWGEHWGIAAADQYGRLTIISNRGFRGGVTEELWQDIVGTAQWRVVDNLTSELHAYSIVEGARSRIGNRYDFWTWNCQHLVYCALGLKPQSPQRDAVAAAFSMACLVLIVGMSGKRG